MTKRFATIFLILASLYSKGNANVYLDYTGNDSAMYILTEVSPSFGESPSDLSEYMLANLNYPDEAYEKKIMGNVYVRFVVETDGSITHANVNRSDNPVFNAEALRLVRGMPRWKPGTIAGKPVRTLYGFPLQFMLSGENKEAVLMDANRPKLRERTSDRRAEQISTGKGTLKKPGTGKAVQGK